MGDGMDHTRRLLLRHVAAAIAAATLFGALPGSPRGQGAGGVAGTVGAAPETAPIGRALTGSVATHVVRPGDTLPALSARWGVGVATLAAANGLGAGAALVPGAALRIDHRHIVPVVSDANQRIVVNLPQRMVFVAGDGGVRGFPVAIGMPGWQTPLGAFRVLAKEQHPVWDVPASIQDEMREAGREVITSMPPGPDNPLGDHWIGLSLPGIGIHGTPAPASVYSAATHGCLRLHADDVAALYAGVAVGDAGVIVYQPVLLAITDAGVFVEAHRDVYGRGAYDVDDLRASAATARVEARVDWAAVAEVLRRADGVARDVTAAGATAGAR